MLEDEGHSDRAIIFCNQPLITVESHTVRLENLEIGRRFFAQRLRGKGGLAWDDFQHPSVQNDWL